MQLTQRGETEMQFSQKYRLPLKTHGNSWLRTVKFLTLKINCATKNYKLYIESKISMSSTI